MNAIIFFLVSHDLSLKDWKGWGGAEQPVVLKQFCVARGTAQRDAVTDCQCVCFVCQISRWTTLRWNGSGERSFPILKKWWIRFTKSLVCTVSGQISWRPSTRRCWARTVSSWCPPVRVQPWQLPLRARHVLHRPEAPFAGPVPSFALCLSGVVITGVAWVPGLQDFWNFVCTVVFWLLLLNFYLS